jgi:hypothetical protein
MKNHLVRAAVLAALAGAASTTLPTVAGAAAYTLHISGASAQRTFWESDLEGIATGKFGSTSDNATPANVLCTLIKTSATLNPPVPDLHSLTCAIAATANRFTSTIKVPTGVNPSDTIQLSYEAEFGSVWGIAPFLTPAIVGGSGSQAVINGGRREVTCSGVTSYSRDLDTASTCLTANPVPVDIGVSDAEPIFWALPDNWSCSDGVTSNACNGTGTNNVINILSIPGQGAPTLAQLQTLEKNLDTDQRRGLLARGEHRERTHVECQQLVDTERAGDFHGPVVGLEPGPRGRWRRRHHRRLPSRPWLRHPGDLEPVFHPDGVRRQQRLQQRRECRGGSSALRVDAAVPRRRESR